MAGISVIVPVYKTEKYQKKCVDSILHQTFTDLELILIDDGSPDLCPAICDEYAKRDARVKVLHKENEGVAAARNSGMNIAEGAYIAFVDSDDWIEPEMYQSMMRVAHQYNSDVVMCDCLKAFPDHSEIYTHDIREGFYDYAQLKTEYYPHLLMMENIEYPPTISNWVCLFRRELIEKPVRYVEGVRYSEDLLFGAQMMYRARSFYYLKGKTFYHYCMNPQSATHTYSPEKWKDYSKLYKEAENYFSRRTDYDFRKQLDWMLLFFVWNAVGDIRNAGISKEESLHSMKEILSDPEVRNLFCRLRIHKLPVSKKLRLLTGIYKYQFGLSFLV